MNDDNIIIILLYFFDDDLMVNIRDLLAVHIRAGLTCPAWNYAALLPELITRPGQPLPRAPRDRVTTLTAGLSASW
jgi:hypothetical protein